MKKIVIQPGGYHPFHAGHYSLYKAAEEKFPDADVYLAATNDTKTRPFPFEIKKKLAQLAGVKPEQFVQVNSPFKAKEITQKYNPNEDVLIFVRSEKDKNEEPIPGITKKDGSPSYFQPYDPDNLQPFSKHAYIEYLPTIEFGPGIKSATEIRNSWPSLSDRQKLAMVLSLYPATQKNKKLADLAVKMLDAGIVGDQVTEDKEEKQQYDIDPSEISATGDERELLAFLRRYYPESRTTLGAFIKFVLHSLEHSKEDSEKQESEINKLKQILKKIEHRLNSVEAQSQLQNVTESRSSGYKEVEFVCVNPKYPDATDPELQKKLFIALKKIPGVIPLLQVWDDYDEISLTAIYRGAGVRRQIINLAKQLGVEIDLEQPVSDDYVDRAIMGNHEGQQEVLEATLVNDPEQGHLIQPDGGMGTWDEQSLLNNLVRKFASMAEMIKQKQYSSLYNVLYKAGVVENMLKALIEYENFKEKQGNRPIAKNRSVDMSQVKESTDYIQEK